MHICHRRRKVLNIGGGGGGGGQGLEYWEAGGGKVGAKFPAGT